MYTLQASPSSYADIDETNIMTEAETLQPPPVDRNDILDSVVRMRAHDVCVRVSCLLTPYA